MTLPPSARHRLSRLLGGVVLLLLGLFLAGCALGPPPADQPSLATQPGPTGPMPQPAPSIQATPTWTDPTPPPLAMSPTRALGLTTPESGDLVLLLTPAPGEVGWSSSLSDRFQDNAPNIHSGFFQGHLYHGAIRFDLSEIPPGATITFAALELTGLDAARLAAQGSWQARLLVPDLSIPWPEMTHEQLHEAPAMADLDPILRPGMLAAGRVNTFTFSPTQRQLLELAIRVGYLVVRVDGPTGPEDNLFSWRSGYAFQTRPQAGDSLNSPENESRDGGRPLLVIHVQPPSADQLVVVTATPTPQNVVTAAALAMQATTIAESTGTFTPTPANWVAPIVVTSTPTPESEATAIFQAAEAAARTFLYGTATATPFYVWTATPTVDDFGLTEPPIPLPPTATPVPLLIPVLPQTGTPSPTITSTPTPAAVPDLLINKIAFRSDREGQAQLYVINPDGSGLARLTAAWYYDQAVRRDRLSADQRFRAFVRDARNSQGSQPAIFVFDSLFLSERQVTTFGGGIAYDPVWSPRREEIALVSNDSGNDEIWLIQWDGSQPLQLTQDTFSWWDKHPSWSPDGEEIVFWSNRSGERQLWIMDRNGKNVRRISQPGANDWDPVWIKYGDPPAYDFAD